MELPDRFDHHQQQVLMDSCGDVPPFLSAYKDIKDNNVFPEKKDFRQAYRRRTGM
jgi:hypothetical protein